MPFLKSRGGLKLTVVAGVAMLLVALASCDMSGGGSQAPSSAPTTNSAPSSAPSTGSSGGGGGGGGWG